MKAWIISDLHLSPLEFLHRRQLIVPNADICVCAGDIAESVERAVDFLHAEIAPHMPVVAVLGNHDCYGHSVSSALKYARKWNAGTNVHILENETFQKRDLRIVAATLWTDFAMTDHPYRHLPLPDRREIAMQGLMQRLPDFRQILSSTFEVGRYIDAGEMLSRHEESRAYIRRELLVPFIGTTMVLTHHAPSRRSLDPRFVGRSSNAAYASDLSDLIRAAQPHFWVHGHIHRFTDYIEGATRVLCNPRGLARETRSGGFRPGFVIETTVIEGTETNDV